MLYPLGVTVFIFLLGSGNAPQRLRVVLFSAFPRSAFSGLNVAFCEKDGRIAEVRSSGLRFDGMMHRIVLFFSVVASLVSIFLFLVFDQDWKFNLHVLAERTE